jgi:hypothetical protein
MIGFAIYGALAALIVLWTGLRRGQWQRVILAASGPALVAVLFITSRTSHPAHTVAGLAVAILMMLVGFVGYRTQRRPTRR